jgi:hypothetical protein
LHAALLFQERPSALNDRGETPRPILKRTLSIMDIAQAVETDCYGKAVLFEKITVARTKQRPVRGDGEANVRPGNGSEFESVLGRAVNNRTIEKWFAAEEGEAHAIAGGYILKEKINGAERHLGGHIAGAAAEVAFLRVTVSATEIAFLRDGEGKRMQTRRNRRPIIDLRVRIESQPRQFLAQFFILAAIEPGSNVRLRPKNFGTIHEQQKRSCFRIEAMEVPMSRSARRVRCLRPWR